jgi:hypothetical protein
MAEPIVSGGPIRWEAPPPRAAKGGGGPRAGYVHRNWEIIGAALRARPGEWAVACNAPSAITAGTIANHIRRGIYTRMGEGPFNAVSRTVEGQHRVYARYVGEAGSEATTNDLRESTGDAPGEAGRG